MNHLSLLVSLLVLSGLSTTLGWMMVSPHHASRSIRASKSTLSFVPGHIPEEILRGRHDPPDDPDDAIITHTDEAKLEQAHSEFQQQQQQQEEDHRNKNNKISSYRMMGSWHKSRKDPTPLVVMDDDDDEQEEEEDCEHPYFDQTTGDSLCWGLFDDDTVDEQALEDAMNSLTMAEEDIKGVVLANEEEEECANTYFDMYGDALCWFI
jgi:hypothetical protein